MNLWDNSNIVESYGGSIHVDSTPGVGNTWHLAMEVFKNVTGTHMTHIPYKGGAAAMAE